MREEQITTEESTQAARELLRYQRQVNRIALIGRWLCVFFFLVFCVAMGVGNLAFQIASGVVTALAVIAEIAMVTVFSKRIAALRAKAEPDVTIVETELFRSLAEDFTFDEMKSWTDRVDYKTVRAFRDDYSLEVEFTMKDGTVLSAVFDNDRARLIVNDHEESAYYVQYRDCESKSDVYSALSDQIRLVMA